MQKTVVVGHKNVAKENPIIISFKFLKENRKKK